MKHLKVHNPVFGLNTEFVLCSSDKEFDKYIENTNKKIPKINLRFSSETHNWFFFKYKWKWMVVFRTQNIWTIAHELVHLIFEICEDRWIPTRIENDEVFAYMMWFYITEVVKGLNIKRIVTTI